MLRKDRSEMDELLIEKVREHEVLYNRELSDYRDQHIRQAAWEEIGKELQISANKAKERWDKLRRCFCNARNRRRDNTRSGMASKKKISWKYEEQMSFITRFLESRKPSGNLNEFKPDYASEESETVESTFRQSEFADFDTDDIESERKTEENQPADDEATFVKGETAEDVKTLQSTSKRQRIDSKKQKTVDVLKGSSALRKYQYEEKARRSQLSKAATLLETLDETDLFFLSMSRMTKKLPKAEQTQIKLALSNSVLSAELRCQQSQSSTSCSQNTFH